MNCTSMAPVQGRSLHSIVTFNTFSAWCLFAALLYPPAVVPQIISFSILASLRMLSVEELVQQSYSIISTSLMPVLHSAARLSIL